MATINSLSNITRLRRDAITVIEDDLLSPKQLSLAEIFDEIDQIKLSNERVLVVLNGNNPPTVKRYTKFNMVNATGGINNIEELSADQTFTWSAGNFPAQSDGTWYLYCLGNDTNSDYMTDIGDYGASKNAISWSDDKKGWYNSDGKVIAQFTSTGGVVSDLIIFEEDKIIADIVPASTPGAVGQSYYDTTEKQFYFSVGTSASTDWISTRDLAWTVETKTADYTLTTTDLNKMIVANPNTVSQYGILNIELPLGASTILGRPYKIEHGVNQGLIKINVNSGGSDKIIYKGQELTSILLFTKGDKWNLIWDGTNWLSEGGTVLQINWQARSDYTNVHIGNGVTYDNKSAAVDLSGQIITEATSGFTGIILYDSGGTGTSGTFYVYELSSTFTFWTNDRQLTASDGTTCDVNEVSGSSKNVDYDFHYGMQVIKNLFKINFFVSPNTVGTYTSAVQYSMHGTGTGSYGMSYISIDSTSFKVQTGLQGIVGPLDTGTVTAIDTEDYTASLTAFF